MSMGILHTFEFNEYGTEHTKRRDVKKFTLKKVLTELNGYLLVGDCRARTGRYIILYINISLLCIKGTGRSGRY